jgi:hypothetical protein
MWHVWKIGEMRTGLKWRVLRERDHLEGISVDVRMILKQIFKKWDRAAWNRFIWLRIGTGGGVRECGDETSGFYEMRETVDL